MKSIPHITIQDKTIGPGHPCFIVAEISGNHHQKYEEAAELVRAAAAAGSDAVKLQTYTPDTITMDSDKEWFRVGGDNPEGWKGKTLYQLYQEAYTPWEWQPRLKAIADDLGIPLFSSPFDETAVDFLEAMLVPCYKVASYEATHIPLLKKIAGTKKPVIMSIGYASAEEVEEAVRTLKENGSGEIAVLHCVTGYSATPRLEDMHLATIADIRERFGVVSGFSENNGGIDIPIMAVAAGASILEKHLILRRSDGGPDAQFSLEPDELKAMITRIREYERTRTLPCDQGTMAKAMGDVHYDPLNSTEEYNRRWRRSIFADKNIRQGEELTAANIRVIRPAFGLEPKFFESVLGKKAAHDVERGTPMTWDLII